MGTICKTLSILSSSETKQPPEKIHSTSINMVSGYHIMLTTCVEILCALWSYNLHKIHKLPTCVLQVTHSNTQNRLSVLISLFFCFCICCLQVDRQLTAWLPGISLGKLLLSFTYSVVHLHLTGCQLLTPAWKSIIYWKTSIENDILFQNREKKVQFCSCGTKLSCDTLNIPYASRGIWLHTVKWGHCAPIASEFTGGISFCGDCWWIKPNGL